MPPVIAIAAAAATVGTGMAALAAGSSLVGGLMIAGGVASGLGAVTGNKTLSTLGMLASLGGGAAGLASGAWDNVATSAAQQSLLGDSASTASDTAMAAGENVMADSASTASDTAMAAGENVMAPDTSVMGSYMAPPSTPAATGETSGLVDSAKPPATPSPITAPKPPVDQTFAPGSSANTASDTAMANGPNVNSGVVNSAATAGSPLSQFLKGVPQWIEQHKETAKAAAGLVGGAMKSYGDQALLKQRYDLQDQYEQKQRQRYSNSVQGLQVPQYRAPTNPLI